LETGQTGGYVSRTQARIDADEQDLYTGIDVIKGGGDAWASL